VSYASAKLLSMFLSVGKLVLKAVKVVEEVLVGL
jgi:hypothetical protein